MFDGRDVSRNQSWHHWVTSKFDMDIIKISLKVSQMVLNFEVKLDDCTKHAIMVKEFNFKFLPGQPFKIVWNRLYKYHLRGFKCESIIFANRGWNEQQKKQLLFNFKMAVMATFLSSKGIPREVIATVIMPFAGISRSSFFRIVLKWNW